MAGSQWTVQLSRARCNHTRTPPPRSILSQSTFITHLLDLSHSELRRPAKGASLVKLQSLLDLALNTDTQGEDAMFREDVCVTMATSGLYEWLIDVLREHGVIGEDTGKRTDAHSREESKKDRDKDEKKSLQAIDALTLDYTVKFPLSLVISRKTVLRYQLIFRFLLHLKHVEQTLTSMWLEQKVPVWRRAPPASEWGMQLENWRKRVFLLRARMLAFVQHILGFTTFEVLEPNWRKLEGKLEARKVETVDQLLKEHVDFLDTCLKECMLTSSRLLGAYSRLMTTCSTFALYASSFTKSLNSAFASEGMPEGDKEFSKRWDYLNKFETHFNHWFKIHLDLVQYDASRENGTLLPLVVRLSSIKSSL